MSRKLIAAHALIAFQIIMAIGYYTWRSDPLDERFAWRMFSVERLTQCRVGFRVGDPPKPVRTRAVFHQAWASTAERGRREVIAKMALHLCKKNPGEPVTVVARCKALSETRDLSAGSFNICKTGSL